MRLKAKKYLIPIAIFVFLVISIFSLSRITSASMDEAKNKRFLKEVHDLIVEDNNDNDKICRSRAVKIAKDFSKSIMNECKIYVGHYYLTTDSITYAAFPLKAKEMNPNLNKDESIKIERLPVWIITYSGLKSPSMQNGVFMRNSIMVIDAETGEPLFGSSDSEPNW